MKRQTGFTLIELMITVVILGVLAAVAVPAFQEIRANNRISTTVNDLVVSFARARNEAVSRSRQVCVQADSVDADGNWQDRWRVGAAEADGSCALADPAAEVYLEMPLSSIITLSASAASFVFSPQGRLNGVADNEVMTVCYQGYDRGREVELRRIGRAFSGGDVACP